MNSVVTLLLHAVDRLRAELGHAYASVYWKVNAPQSFEHAFCLVDDGADGGCLGAFGVQLVLHKCDELLAGLVRSVFVDNVVEVEEKCAYVLDLVVAL